MPESGDPIVAALERSGLPFVRRHDDGVDRELRPALERLGSEAAPLSGVDRAILNAEAIQILMALGISEADAARMVDAALTAGRSNGRAPATPREGRVPTSAAGFVLVGGPMAEVAPERVSWLWPDRIPFGKLTILDGDPGLAKSLLTLDLAARLSQGRALPDGAPTERAASIVLTAEDGLGDTVRPRLDAMNADPALVFAYVAAMVPGEDDALSITLPTHIAALAAQIRETGARLVIVDPLMAFLSAEVNSRIDHDVRRLLAQLTRLAEETGAAIILIRHLNKMAAGSALYRGGGSIGIIGAARSGLLVARDPDDESKRILAVTKSNLAREAPSLRFRVETASNGAARLEWEGETTHRANELVMLPADPEERQESVDLKAFIRELVEAVPRTQKEAVAAIRAAGFDSSERTIRRARRAAGVQVERQGFGPGSTVIWSLGNGHCGHIPAIGAIENDGAGKASMGQYGDGLERLPGRGDAYEERP